MQLGTIVAFCDIRVGQVHQSHDLLTAAECHIEFQLIPE